MKSLINYEKSTNYENDDKKFIIFVIVKNDFISIAKWTEQIRVFRRLVYHNRSKSLPTQLYQILYSQTWDKIMTELEIQDKTMIISQTYSKIWTEHL